MTRSCNTETILSLIHLPVNSSHDQFLRVVVRVFHELGVFGISVGHAVGDLQSTGPAHGVAARIHRQMSVCVGLFETDVIVIRSH